MSGGHYDYKYFKILELSEEIGDDLKNPELKLSSEVNDALIFLREDFKRVSEIAHSLEWFLSDDIGEEEFLKDFKAYRERLI